MNSKIVKLLLLFLVVLSLFSGCETSYKSEQKQERISEYGESDKPWGENNYKRIGIISNFEKNLEDNITTADFQIKGESADKKIKIYGTDIDTSKYYNEKVFLSGVKDSSYDEEYVLVKRYDDIDLVNEEITKSIDNLNSIQDQYNLTKVKDDIDDMSCSKDYREYLINRYNDKVSELNFSYNKEQQEVFKAKEADK